MTALADRPAPAAPPPAGSRAAAAYRDPDASQARHRALAAPRLACRAMGDLATVNASTLTVAELADCLRDLEAAEAALTAARASVLWAFRAANGPADDGHGSAKTWVRWQARVTEGAAGGAVAWARRLHEHPVVAEALASGQLSASWARTLCAWSDLLPGSARSRADRILAEAAVSGAELADLASLADQIRHRTAGPDVDRGEPSDGFADRGLRLGVTFGGAGRLEADLSASCTAALSAVLDALGKKAGPEDTRTRRQRSHDALEEACRRLISARHLPARAGQPTLIQLHMTLDRLRRLPAPGDRAASGSAAPDGTIPPGLTSHRRPEAAVPSEAERWPAAAGWPAAPPGAECDASIVPVVSGHLDPELLDHLIRELRDSAGGGAPAPAPHPARSSPPGPGARPGQPPSATPGQPGRRRTGAVPPAGKGRPPTATEPPPGSRSPADGPPGPYPSQLPRGAHRTAADGGPVEADCGPASQRAGRALRDLVAGRALDLLSGPSGLAAWLRASRLDGVAGSASLPLDIGAATETVPAHLRRAVIARDRHCRFPGCTELPAACQAHHVIPRRQDGPTSLRNLVLLCSFHHLIVVHRWGWALALHADGEVTATSPDGGRVYRSRQSPQVKHPPGERSPVPPRFPPRDPAA